MKDLKFCYTKNIPIAKSVSNTMKAIAYKEKYWPKGYEIKVYFMDGTEIQKKQMKSSLETWLQHLSLSVSYVSEPSNSDIRISFKYGHGSWSYVGIDALFIPKTESTLNIGWEDVTANLHECGHMLGLGHEHQNWKKGIVWNEEEVIKDLSGAPNYWTESEIRHNVLNKISKEVSEATDFDPNSIMLYYFPNSWTVGDFQTNINMSPSKQDIEFLKSKYNIIDTIAPVITLNGESTISLIQGEEYIEQGATAKDNVDGNISNKILIDVDVSNEIGLHYVTYTATDKAGNKTEKIRTIQVKEEFDMKEFLKELFPTKYRLKDLVESQVVLIANRLGLNASEEDLRQDTVDKVWNELNS